MSSHVSLTDRSDWIGDPDKGREYPSLVRNMQSSQIVSYLKIRMFTDDLKVKDNQKNVHRFPKIDRTNKQQIDQRNLEIERLYDEYYIKHPLKSEYLKLKASISYICIRDIRHWTQCNTTRDIINRSAPSLIVDSDNASFVDLMEVASGRAPVKITSMPLIPSAANVARPPPCTSWFKHVETIEKHNLLFSTWNEIYTKGLCPDRFIMQLVSHLFSTMPVKYIIRADDIPADERSPMLSARPTSG